MITHKPKKILPCSKCTGKCANCSSKKPYKPNKLEKMVHRILKTSPLGCHGESWRCFLKSKHMFLYCASALVSFVIGNTTDVIFEKKVQDLIFPAQSPQKEEPPKAAFYPQTQEHFKIKEIIRNMDTNEKTAILESMSPPGYIPQKITTQKVPFRLQKNENTRCF